MFQLDKLTENKQEAYRQLTTMASALLEGESDPIANCANLASLIYCSLPGLNWAGFYFLKGDELVLGPFMGKPACVRIALGRGVCGTAASEQKIQLVEDVHAFEGHIACDADSRSEIVLPLIKKNGELLGVLDLDSPSPARFDEQDAGGLTELTSLLLEKSAF